MINRTIRLGIPALTALGVLASSQTAQSQATLSNAGLTVLLNSDGYIRLTTNALNDLLNLKGTSLYLRVYDVPFPISTGTTGTTIISYYGPQTYRVGDVSSLASGLWIQPPTLTGNHIDAEWRTGSLTFTGANPNGTDLVYTPNIRVKILITFVGNIARFQFTIQNQGSSLRTFDAAFVEDIDVAGQLTNGFNVAPDGPLRPNNGPYLDRETLFYGSQIPNSIESFYTLAGATGNTTHSIKALLRPTTATQTEPTPPIKMAYARRSALVGDNLWTFTPATSILLGRGAVSTTDAALALYYYTSENLTPNGSTRSIVTYVGQSFNDGDYSQPLGLQVSSPPALNYTQNSPAPNPFAVTATVANSTGLNGSPAFGSGRVTLTLQLPAGLELAPGETLTKTIDNVASGAESSITWQVRANGAASGRLTYSVSAGAASVGAAGKVVQRTIEVPAPATLLLKGKDAAGIKYRMVSFPLLTSSVNANELLGLSDSDYEIVKYDPTVSAGTSPYSTVRLTKGGLKPGYGYWIYSRLNVDKSIPINTTIAKPIDNQIQPNTGGATADFTSGWQIIGNPYVYGIRFSEQTIKDTAGTSLSAADAADPVNGWISQAIWRWDTSDPDSRNWRYVLVDSIGFTMDPYDAYWMFVRKPSITVTFTGVDTPGTVVTRAASGSNLVGQNRRDNWRLRLTAKSSSGLDTETFVGVAPKASDHLDGYKYEKPPVLDNRLEMSIVNQNYDSGRSRFAQDLRSPSLTRKTWNLMIRSSKPNEDVAVSWASLASSVPQDYQLTLVDDATNSRTPLRTRASVTVNTGGSGVKTLTLEASPTRGAGRVRITNFEIVEGNSRAAGVASAVTINYNTTQASETRIVIRDRSGRAIRTLVSNTRAAEAGNGSVVWDMKNGQGTGVAAGLYNVEVLAVGEDGQTDRQVRPYVVTR